eukprot:CAMPEP_0203825674 /NCGR_PEP_ID=MMETSP0115-20131106/54824_1 /ASSEMBLY_ACC=CAM_ASM_000227 /TAXON_ID=33651 /ORGANISM="Bicosoecid sp, Strain ms1" /LENGTH=201 /DNA_ID=CAMNT_0050734719 /DNA_START=1 /DNA_END=603 /DNA_ORIENTATION=+
MASSDVNVVVTMTVVSCADLDDKATFGKQDPYVKGQTAGQKFQTPVCVDGGTTPVWTEGNVFKFIFYNRSVFNAAKLFLSVKNKNKFSDSTIGDLTLEWKDTIEHRDEEWGYVLQNSSDEAEGTVNLLINVFDPVEEAEKRALEEAHRAEVEAAAAAAEEAARVEMEAKMAEQAAAAAEAAAALEAAAEEERAELEARIAE